MKLPELQILEFEIRRALFQFNSIVKHFWPEQKVGIWHHMLMNQVDDLQDSVKKDELSAEEAYSKFADMFVKFDETDFTRITDYKRFLN